MVDPERVQWLVDGISEVVTEELEGNPTSSSEVVSALFTVLGRILNMIRKMPSSDERDHNIALINQVLLEMMIEAKQRVH